ncbi:MAG: alpha-mannosidase [Frankiales bacterium]|jgi:alpha-mannosidase|nr:alpha-mannosidase [Frankiales bacterium]
MHDDSRFVEDRLRRVLRERLRPALYAHHEPMTVEAWVVPGEPVPVHEALAAVYAPMSIGDAWGKPWSTTWMRLRGTVPQAWAGQRVEVVVDLGFSSSIPGFQAEALAYTLDGVPIKGIAPRNSYVPVSRSAAGGEPVQLLLEAAANPTVLTSISEDGRQVGDFRPTGLGERETAGEAPLYVLSQAALAVLDETVWHLVLDVEVLAGVMGALSSADPRRYEILRALERMLDDLDLHNVAETAAGARKHLAEVLAKPANASAHRISAVGHAHIDSAWLWPIRETKRKCARTFANVTALAEDYPELVFACSQAQQYAWVKEQHPAIFDRIKQAVAGGQWAPVGGMWVESDANLPGGEALARQLVHGKRFFRDELAYDTPEVWLPDSFGYSAAFPQIARLAGARWFLTQKLSWNQTNRLPHHTFWWEGIDGTRVFTHFPPVDTYNAQLTGAELAHASANYADKGGGTRSLVPFGFGDGGGGPTREMLERARRVADLEGSPRVQVESPSVFFAAAEAEYANAPVWSGELYLESHRATYTTQSTTKAGNRRSEHLLREAELYCAAATVHGGAVYPYERLDALWKVVLLHQFHDILPGSSIGWVHREAAVAYAQVASELEGLIVSAIGGVGGPPDQATALNAGPVARAEVAVLPAGLPVGNAATQQLRSGDVAAWLEAPALGSAAIVRRQPPGAVSVAEQPDGWVLDNGLVRVEIDTRGLVTSVVDLRVGRDLLSTGRPANLLQLHPDHPNNWDAWDIDGHYRRAQTDLDSAESVYVSDRGPLLASVVVERAFGASTVRQTVTLAAGSARVDFVADVDWHETEKVLKVAFPLDVHAERSAAEIQYGHVFRPTHTNTSWDAARFEVCAHRWIHVAEANYGVGVVNAATYGHDVTRTTRPAGGTTTTVRLTLLRAPQFPQPRTDEGLHRFQYGLVVGADLVETMTHGYAVNLPLRSATAAPLEPLVAVDSERVVVEAVKLADDRSGDVIVRLYEAAGSHAHATVRFGFPSGEAWVTDLLEDPLLARELAPGIECGEGWARLSLRPFQVVTLRISRA